MENTEKQKIITYSIILLFCIIVCSPLLQMHIASDTYNYMDLGYFEYPSQSFLLSARLISTIVSYIAGILNLPYSIFIVGMEMIAIVIAAMSIYTLYTTITEKRELKSYEINLKNVLLAIGATLIIFNCMSLEYFLYAECSVMCLAVFLCVLGARIFTKKNEKYRYIKTLILVILATFAYQGCVNIFITLVVLMLFIDKNEKTNKETIKEIFLAGTIIVIGFLVNAISIFAITDMMNFKQERIVEGGILNNLYEFVPIIKSVFYVCLVYNYGYLPKMISIIFIGITTVLIPSFKKPISKLVKYYILLIIAIASCTAPLFLMKQPSTEPRTIMSIGSIIGISLIYLNAFETDKKMVSNIIATITIGFFVFNTINTVQIFTAHIVTNKIDDNMGLAISYKLKEYEETSGNTVTKVAYKRDKNHRSFPYGYKKKFPSFTQRAFDNYYCIIEALNYYCNRKFEAVKMDEKIYEENFSGKDWNTYSDEQIVFSGDTMYICTY